MYQLFSQETFRSNPVIYILYIYIYIYIEWNKIGTAVDCMVSFFPNYSPEVRMIIQLCLQNSSLGIQYTFFIRSKPF